MQSIFGGRHRFFAPLGMTFGEAIIIFINFVRD